MLRQRQTRTISRRQGLVGHVVVRGPNAAAGDDGAAASDQLPQAQRGCCNILFVVADDLYAHQVHAAAARSVRQWDRSVFCGKAEEEVRQCGDCQLLELCATAQKKSRCTSCRADQAGVQCAACLYRSFASHGVLVSVTAPDSISVPITRSAARSAAGCAVADVAIRFLHAHATANLEPFCNLAAGDGVPSQYVHALHGLPVVNSGARLLCSASDLDGVEQPAYRSTVPGEEPCYSQGSCVAEHLLHLQDELSAGTTWRSLPATR